MDFEIIHSYTRKEAIADGFQVEIDQKISRAAGIVHPVYFTRTVWDRYVAVPESMLGYQDEAGRLWDILWMFFIEVRKGASNGQQMSFKFICGLPDDGHWPSNEVSHEGNSLQRLITLKSLIGPVDIDDPSPAITILLPNED